jgi:branched-chain amino acid transport system substrate-binding protein
MIAPSEGAMNGVITGEIYMPSLEGDANKAFVDAYKKKNGAEPGKGPLVAYEAVKVIAAGMDKAGTDSDYNKISAAIRSTPLATPRGELKFDAKGRASAPYFFIQQVKDGQLSQIDRVKSQ